MNIEKIVSVTGGSRTMTPYAFMNLLGDANLVAIFTAAKTDVVIELMVEKVRQAQEIDLDDEVLGPKNGLLYCVSQGIITEAEYDRIMAYGGGDA